MKTIRPLHNFVFVMLLLNLTSAAYAGKYALVIGNGAYKDIPLSTTVNDANVMASTLQSLGFSVSKETDISHHNMEQAIRDFGNRLSAGDIALFYFSGHGAQTDGINYLIPIGADIQSEDEIRHKSVPADMVLAKMKQARSAVNILILDACRNNPFKGFKSLSQGLAPMSASDVKGSFITYATAPGSVAYTGTGSTSIYTKHLVTFIQKSGLRIEDVFKRVRESVMADTSDKQIPWESSSLTGKDFYFAGERERNPEPEVQKSEPVADTSPKAKYQLRKTPITTLDEDRRSKFGLNEDSKPLEYIENDFKDNGDGTITDRATGLMWQKSGSDKTLTYEEAKAYVEKLKLAGYSDWRLPTVDELKSLLTQEKQSNDLYINPIFEKKQYNWFWTSDQRSSGGAWGVYFDGGDVGWLVVNFGYVRAVRSRQ
jgi:hypothetical protein